MHRSPGVGGTAVSVCEAPGRAQRAAQRHGHLGCLPIVFLNARKMRLYKYDLKSLFHGSRLTNGGSLGSKQELQEHMHLAGEPVRTVRTKAPVTACRAHGMFSVNTVGAALGGECFCLVNK